MKEITQQELRRKLALEVGADELPTYRSIARLICRAVERWLLVPKSRVIGHVRDQLAAMGLNSENCVERVTEVYERLTLLGVVEAVDLAGRKYCARSEPRWIRVSDDLGVLIGTTSTLDLPHEISNSAAGSMAKLIMKFNPNDLETLAYINAQGVREWTLRDWQGEPSFVEYLLRRNVKCSTPALTDLWEALVSAIENDGLQLSVDAKVHAVAGRPGDYFGRGSREKPDGRWTVDPSDGVWCAVRAGYSERHWQPILLKVDGDRRFAIDFYDWNEWKWALLARGLALGRPEQGVRNGQSVSFNCPLPDDTTRLLHLVADSHTGWKWTVPENLPDIWTVS